MFEIRNRRYVAPVAMAGLLLTAGPAMAVPTLELSSGATTITIVDGGAGDANGAAGAVTFVGMVGVFDINVSTGITKPANGSPAFPDIDLNSVNTSNTGGTLVVKFSETDFVASGTKILNTDVGGTTQGSTTFSVDVDTGNNIFGSTQTVFAGGPFSGGSFSDKGSSPFTHVGSYSITQTATVTHGALGGTTSFDIQTTVPLPATAGLLGVGLFGLGVALRRRRRHG